MRAQSADYLRRTSGVAGAFQKVSRFSATTVTLAFGNSAILLFLAGRVALFTGLGRSCLRG